MKKNHWNCKRSMYLNNLCYLFTLEIWQTRYVFTYGCFNAQYYNTLLAQHWDSGQNAIRNARSLLHLSSAKHHCILTFIKTEKANEAKNASFVSDSIISKGKSLSNLHFLYFFDLHSTYSWKTLLLKVNNLCLELSNSTVLQQIKSFVSFHGNIKKIKIALTNLPSCMDRI